MEDEDVDAPTFEELETLAGYCERQIHENDSRGPKARRFGNYLRSRLKLPIDPLRLPNGCFCPIACGP